MKIPKLVAAMVLMAPTLSLAALQPIDALRRRQRVVLAASPHSNDPNLEAQRQVLQAWRDQAADRDVKLVIIDGRRVDGVSDSAAALRQRFHLKADRFEALLIGKDGRVALRAGKPVTADVLQTAIDAMPMRRAGER